MPSRAYYERSAVAQAAKQRIGAIVKGKVQKLACVCEAVPKVLSEAVFC